MKWIDITCINYRNMLELVCVCYNWTTCYYNKFLIWNGWPDRIKDIIKHYKSKKTCVWYFDALESPRWDMWQFRMIYDVMVLDNICATFFLIYMGIIVIGPYMLLLQQRNSNAPMVPKTARLSSHCRPTSVFTDKTSTRGFFVLEGLPIHWTN